MFKAVHVMLPALYELMKKNRFAINLNMKNLTMLLSHDYKNKQFDL